MCWHPTTSQQVFRPLALSPVLSKKLLTAFIYLGGFASMVLLAQTPGPTAAPSPASFTVAFWNIQWFPGGRPNPSRGMQTKQIDSVHAELAALNPDILGMEEVRDFQKAGVAVAPVPGFKVDVCANFPPREGQKEAQQTAIASRLQPLSAWAELWQRRGAMQPPRGFAFAAYQLTPQDLLLVYCVHFKSNRGDPLENVALRQESMRQLLAHLDSMKAAYEKVGRLSWIVGGDFNTSPDDRRFASETTLPDLLKSGFSWNWQGIPFDARITLPSEHDFPPACFDHIFYRGLKLQRTWVANTSRQSSDHRAIVATFELPNQ